MIARSSLTCIVLVTVLACVGAAGRLNIHPINEDLDWTFRNNAPVERDTKQQPTKPVNLQYPAAVLVGRTCGGTIISPKWVLTAAHCTLFFRNPGGPMDVIAGTNTTDDGSGVRVRVKKLYIHPRFMVGPHWLDASNFGFNQIGARWDFMLAELETPLKLDGKKIAAANVDTGSKLVVGDKVGFAGYGAEYHGGLMQREMHAAELEVRLDEECAVLPQYDPEDMLCTRGRRPNYHTACNGDSGSGLISGTRVLGVASWVQDDAIECAPKKLIVFSRVSAVRNWIYDIAHI